MMNADKEVKNTLFFSRIHIGMFAFLCGAVTLGVLGMQEHLVVSIIEWVARAAIGALLGLSVLLLFAPSWFLNENVWHYFIQRGKMLNKIEEKVDSNVHTIDDQLQNDDSLTEEQIKALQTYKFLLLLSKKKVFDYFINAQVKIEELDGKVSNKLLLSIWYVCNYPSWRIANKLFDISAGAVGAGLLLYSGFFWTALVWFSWFMVSSIAFSSIYSATKPIIEMVKEESKDIEPSDEEVDDFVASVMGVDLSED